MSPGRKKTVAPSKTRGALQDLAELRSLRKERAHRADSGVPTPRGRAPKGNERPPEPREDHSEFELLKGLSRTITAELDLGRVARSILDQARGVLGADRGVIFLGKPDAAGLVPLLAVDIHGEELQEVGQVSRTILAKAKSGELVVTGEAAADPRFSSAASIPLNQMRSIICGPLISPAGPIGVLYLDAIRAHAFLKKSADFFKAMADIAALALEHATVHGELLREIAELRSQRLPISSFDRIAGVGERMGLLRRQAEVAARLDGPVLIVGESGTGRRRLAWIIHEASRRSRMPFLECDCSAIDSDQVKGVLFGRTGPAAKTYPHPEPGLIRQAEPGGLLLADAQALDDEFGDTVVRLGERGAYRPMGNRREGWANVRLYVSLGVAKAGWRTAGRRIGFRRLAQWYRLSIPPLRERPEDIPMLAVQFVSAALGPRMESGAVPCFTSDAIEQLIRHSWPGNLRELKHAVQRMLLTTARIPITGAAVEEALKADGGGARGALGPWSGEIRTMREWTDEAIRLALVRTNGNKSAAARLLGVHRNTIVLRSKSLGATSEKD